MNKSQELDVDYLNDIWLEDVTDRLIDEGIEESEAQEMAVWAMENDVQGTADISREFREARQKTEEDTDQKEQDYRRAIGAN